MQKNVKKKKKLNGCYHCGATSHRAKHCPEIRCRICNEIGHDAGGCPTKPSPPVDIGQFHYNDVNMKKDENKKFTYIELFAGMGGFRVALDKLGGACVFASEVDRFCKANYQLNFNGDRPAGDIFRIDVTQIPNHDLLVGGFPCQPFSSSGTRMGINDPSGKGLLFREITRILKDKQPRGFLLENVRGLYLHDGGNTLKLVEQELGDCGYVVKHELVNAVDLLPQERCRLFFVGIRRDIKDAMTYKFPILPNLQRGVEDILHVEGELSPSHLETLTLNNNQLNKVRSQLYTKEHPEARFLSDPTVAAKTLQSSYTKYMVGSQFVPVLFGRDDKWRRFSQREAARLQGFPETFQLCNDRAYHMIGNAVAPPVIAMVTGPLLRYIQRDEDVSQELGWHAARSLLLEAVPKEGYRRERLREKILNVMNDIIE